MHPVLKVRKFHRGVDFAAPKGTPVYAAADGFVDAAGWRGNYGHFIRLRHSDRLDTTYGHLDGYAEGLTAGGAVRKGDVIGYVGSSGLAMGPHLYYEVLIDKVRVDPLRRDLASLVHAAMKGRGKKPAAYLALEDDRMARRNDASMAP